VGAELFMRKNRGKTDGQTERQTDRGGCDKASSRFRQLFERSSRKTFRPRSSIIYMPVYKRFLLYCVVHIMRFLCVCGSTQFSRSCTSESSVFWTEPSEVKRCNLIHRYAVPQIKKRDVRIK
jgi:hypothetical protein